MLCNSIPARSYFILLIITQSYLARRAGRKIFHFNEFNGEPKSYYIRV